MDEHTNPLNVYPSTSDVVLPVIAGGSQDSAVLDCIRNARDRYAAFGVGGTYCDVDSEGDVIAVCALGAVAVADGHAAEAASGTWEYTYERLLSDTAREAIRLLDAKATEMFPEFDPSENLDCSCHGTLEAVNEHSDWDEREARVLSIYDAVVADLELQPA